MRAHPRSRKVIFVPFAHPSCHRHTKIRKTEVVISYGELARRLLPLPNPTPAGDKPLASRSLRPHYIPHPRPSGFRPSPE